MKTTKTHTSKTTKEDILKSLAEPMASMNPELKKFANGATEEILHGKNRKKEILVFVDELGKLISNPKCDIMNLHEIVAFHSAEKERKSDLSIGNCLDYSGLSGKKKKRKVYSFEYEF